MCDFHLPFIIFFLETIRLYLVLKKIKEECIKKKIKRKNKRKEKKYI